MPHDSFDGIHNRGRKRHTVLYRIRHELCTRRDNIYVGMPCFSACDAPHISARRGAYQERIRGNGKKRKKEEKTLLTSVI